MHIDVKIWELRRGKLCSKMDDLGGLLPRLPYCLTDGDPPNCYRVVSSRDPSYGQARALSHAG